MEGLVKIGGKQGPILFTAQEMALGDTVQVQYPDPEGNPKCCLTAAVLKKIPVPDDEAVSDEPNDRPVRAYRIKINAKLEEGPFVGMAVIGPNLKVSAYGPNLHIMDGPVRMLMMTCLSTEGLHLFLSTAREMKGHLYMGLGYEVEQTCPDAIFGNR
ncbi:hypothetical protein SAMN05428948_4665 [Massilia sp. CF038]|nr:hypothetical protein SAMN05428948_4665 [Massilia sp. CF038]